MQNIIISSFKSVMVCIIFFNPVLLSRSYKDKESVEEWKGKFNKPFEPHDN